MTLEQVQWYQEISLAILPDDEEPVANYIIENIAGGILFENDEDNQYTIIKFYVPAKEDFEPKLNGLRKYLSIINPAYSDVKLRRKKIKNLDWIEAYKRSVTPLSIGEHIVIKPPWCKDRFPSKVEIILEPKMAFGTGRHETTQGCLIEMEDIDFKGKTVLDLGCGSGILSIYAAFRGAASVKGYDTDPLAIENSRENFEINNVASCCTAEIGDIDSLPPGRTFDVIVVNIIKSVIVPIIGRLKSRMRPKGRLLLAGLRQQDRDLVDAVLLKHDLKNYTIRADGEWSTYNIVAE